MFTVSLDLREFDLKFNKFMAKQSIGALRRGLKLMLIEFIKDVVWDIPTTPILTSALRGSMTAFVNRVLVATSKQYGLTTFQELRDDDPPYTKGEEGKMVVNAPYATTQHENFPKKSEKNAGMYYVLRKLNKYKNKYMKIIVDEVKGIRI